MPLAADDPRPAAAADCTASPADTHGGAQDAAAHGMSLETSGPISLSGFEGPEKLLEITFAPCAAPRDGRGTTACLGLRAVPREQWVAMLAIVQCQVLDVVSNDQQDAYLLSESSMFIADRALVLKTCGTTTLLKALPTILQLARKHAALTPWILFYSRKAFLFPDLQPHPHTSWEGEVDVLKAALEQVDYALSFAERMFGDAQDHWFCFSAHSEHLDRLALDSENDAGIADSAIGLAAEEVGEEGARLDPNDAAGRMDLGLKSSMIHLSPRPHYDADGNVLLGVRLPSARGQVDERDHLLLAPSAVPSTSTIEILMTGLHPASMAQFWRGRHSPGSARPVVMTPGASMPTGSEAERAETQALYEAAGLARLYPGCEASISHHLFDPCGYSLNGILGDHYWTIHVTPESHCSYASFESTVPCFGGADSWSSLVNQVLAIFQPARATIVLAEPSELRRRGSEDEGSHAHEQQVRKLLHLYFQQWEQGRGPFGVQGYDLVPGSLCREEMSLHQVTYCRLARREQPSPGEGDV